MWFLFALQCEPIETSKRAIGHQTPVPWGGPEKYLFATDCNVIPRLFVGAAAALLSHRFPSTASIFFLFGSTQFHFGQFEQFWQMKRTVEGGGSFFSRKWNISQRMFLHQFNEHFNTKNLNSMKFSSIERWQLKGWFSFFFFKFKKYNFGFFFEIS